jgi:hypothetical protein
MQLPDYPLDLSVPPARVHWIYDDPAGRASVVRRGQRQAPIRHAPRHRRFTWEMRLSAHR